MQPRATEYIPQMLAMIGKLVKSGHAYTAEGHVLFSVPSWPDYGRLSRHNRDDMIAGARVEKGHPAGWHRGPPARAPG